MIDIKKWLAVGLGVTVVAVVTSGVSNAGHDSGPGTTLTGCMTAGGDLKNLAAGDVPAKPCGPNDSLVHLSSGDITSVGAGSGLTGGAASGPASLSIAGPFALPQGCGTGAVAKRDAESGWQCGTDIDTNTTYLGGTGIDVTGSLVSLQPGFRLPQSGCVAGDAVKRTAGGWACGADNNTTYSGANFALSGQGCPSGQYATAVSSGGNLQCGAVPTAPGTRAFAAEKGSGGVDRIELRPVAQDQTCCSYPVTTLLSVDVPAGTYLVTSSLELINNANFFGQDNSRRAGCGINTTFFDAYWVDVDGLGRENLSPQRVLSLPGGGVIALQCAMQDGGTDRSYLQAATRSLSALRLDALN